MIIEESDLYIYICRARGGKEKKEKKKSKEFGTVKLRIIQRSFEFFFLFVLYFFEKKK